MARSTIGMNWMKARLHAVAEEAVDLQRMVGISGMDSAQHIAIDAMPLQQFPGSHYQMKGTSTALVHAISVVHFLWAVDAKADKEVVLL